MKKGLILYLMMAGAAVLAAGCSRETGGLEMEKAETYFSVAETEAHTDAGTERTEKAEKENTEAEDIKTENIKTENTKTEQEKAEITAQIGWNPGQKVELGEIQALLENAGIAYTGYYNDTEERLDMELEDGTDLVFLAVSNDTGENRRYELILDGDGNFNASGFQEGYHHEYGVTFDEKFYPDIDERLLTEEDLWMMNLTDLSIARNQIYAVRGRIFHDPFLNAVFRTKSWYEPLYSAEEFEQKAAAFTEMEQANLQAIRKHEEMRKNPVQADGKNLDKKRMLLSGSWLDLDGDGKKEQIFYEITQESHLSEERYHLTVNGVEKSEVTISPYAHLEVLNLDETTTLLSAGGNGPSDDPWSDYYLYEDQDLIFLGGIPGELQGFSDGVLYILAQYDFFQSNRLVFQYRVSRQQRLIVEDYKGFYEYGNQAVAKETIPLYRDQSFEETGITLKPGDVVTILGSDLYHGVQIRKEESGETGWIECESGSGCMLPDGRNMESWELFEGLPFFG